MPVAYSMISQLDRWGSDSLSICLRVVSINRILSEAQQMSYWANFRAGQLINSLLSVLLCVPSLVAPILRRLPNPPRQQLNLGCFFRLYVKCLVWYHPSSSLIWFLETHECSASSSPETFNFTLLCRFQHFNVPSAPNSGHTFRLSREIFNPRTIFHLLSEGWDRPYFLPTRSPLPRGFPTDLSRRSHNSLGSQLRCKYVRGELW